MAIEKVKDIYKELLEKDFGGTYQGLFDKHGKEWVKIQVDPDDPIMETLGKVKDQVQGKVWKGFTGVEDGYTDYCLYVEVMCSPEKERFRIVSVEPFPLTKYNLQKYSWNIGAKMTVKSIA